ncbi:MAG: hypothetical protein AB1425_11450, partial [Actinomycetota bacterium]
MPVELLGYGRGAAAQEAGSADEDAVMGGQPLNVLVLGVDQRPESEEAGTRSDTIMLLRVEPQTGDMKLLSVPR